MYRATRSSSASEVISGHLRLTTPVMTSLAEWSRVQGALVHGRMPVNERRRERDELIRVFKC